MKEQEKLAADALKKFLNERLGLKSDWKPGANPPDFAFTVEAETWAVEETQLHQYIQLRSKPESRLAIERPLEEMCEQIRAKAETKQNRDYIISVFGPVNELLEEIKRSALEYIASGETEAKQLGKTVSISAVTCKPVIAYAIGLDGGVKGGDGQSIAADVRASVCFALDRIMEAKLPKLASLKGFQRRILLISKGYLFADPGELKDILAAKHLTKEQLDSVLLIDELGSIHWIADPGGLFVPWK